MTFGLNCPRLATVTNLSACVPIHTTNALYQLNTPTGVLPCFTNSTTFIFFIFFIRDVFLPVSCVSHLFIRLVSTFPAQQRDVKWSAEHICGPLTFLAFICVSNCALSHYRLLLYLYFFPHVNSVQRFVVFNYSQDVSLLRLQSFPVTQYPVYQQAK